MTRGRSSIKHSILKRTSSKGLVINHTTHNLLRILNQIPPRGSKNLKLQLCRQHFLVEALLIIKTPNLVPPMEMQSAQL